jgi:hypothetical protein
VVSREDRNAQIRAYQRRNAEKERTRKRVYRIQHAAEIRAKKRIYERAHPEKTRSWIRVARYGITPAVYEAMLQRQGGVCAICGELSKRGRLCIDHDPRTGRVRGLLCRKCNLGIGHFEDNADFLAQAIEYLAPKLALLQGA